MRTLKFHVNDQIIEADPACHFDDLVPGTEGYVKAEFYFSAEWTDCVKVAAFWSMRGKEYPPVALKDGCTCMIPAEALKKRSFKMQVIGKGPGIKLTTNKLVITQNGGKT